MEIEVESLEVDERMKQRFTTTLCTPLSGEGGGDVEGYTTRRERVKISP
jgi:hypothetical protein